MLWKVILGILGIVAIFLLVGCKKVTPDPDPEPTPLPDPFKYKWPLIDDTTQRWTDYCKYMQKMTSDGMVATEMKLYKWVSDWSLWNKLDHWALPDVVWKNKKDDCDGLARLSADILGRFVMLVMKLITNVWWLEYYGYYRKYNNNGTYKIVASGHAITVYKKNGKLLAFSNTSWWNYQNFQDFIEIGEQTFPEGIYLVRCRHWETGDLQWIEKAKSGEILKGTNTFNRDKIKGYERR